MSETQYSILVNGHYGRHYGASPLGEVILSALAGSGKDADHPKAEDLAPVDQFHTGGRAWTLDLARLADVTPAMWVLDVGGGLGGSARILANEFGCRVAVLDVTSEYCRAGEMLTERMGLSRLVTFQQGDATDMPFEGQTFDVALSQHSSMNVVDKRRLYLEIHRVLKSETVAGHGGRFVFNEIMAGPVQPVHFPVPWAREESISFLGQPSSVRATIEEAGFRELEWRDMTEQALELYRARSPGSDRPTSGSVTARLSLSLGLLLGEATGEMVRNQVRNLEEERVVVVQGLFERL